jgi:ribosomal protein S18 acetylase RimI-like enzyme
MKNILHFEPITPAVYQSYIEVGTQAYNQHYMHLWPHENSAPYIESSFTKEVLEKEEQDENTILYRIISNKKAVGVLKITRNASLANFSKNEAMYVDKIYILNEYSGKGIGKKALQFAMLRAKEMKKKIVWLDSMQKGPALNFYLKNGFEIHSKNQVTLPTVIETESLMWVMVKKIEN